MANRDAAATSQSRQFVLDLESVQATGWADLALMYARALSALRVVWASRRRLQDELEQAGGRIEFLEDTCQRWSDGFERSKASHREHRAALRSRIAELEPSPDAEVVVEGRRIKRSQLTAVLASYIVTDEHWRTAMDSAQARAEQAEARLAELERQPLGYAVLLKDSDGLTCLAPVFDADSVRTAEGIAAGYAAPGQTYLIAELREVSDGA